MRNSPPPVVADEEDHHHHTTTAETATATAVTVTATATATAETTTTTTTTKTTPVQQEAETNPGQVLFGSMNSELSDALAESLHKAILKGVESLPLLQQTLPLIKRIETPFLKCVDVMEEYARRNIFSLQGIPLKRQQVIVQRVLLGKEEGTATTTTTTTTTTAAITEHPAAAYDYPTQDQIPSSASIQALKEDIQQLQELLKTSKKRRDELLLQTAGLGLAQRLSTKAVDSLQCLPLEEETTTLNVVTAAVRGGKQAQEYTQDSQHLQTRLDHTHKNRAKENEEEDLGPHPKKKRLSLEEEYRQERQIATLDSLSAIQNLLKH